MSLTTLPPLHAPFEGGDPHVALKELRVAIEHAIANQPRSLQKAIGPSGLGTACDHCLAAKLTGWEQSGGGVPWLPFIGTAVHTALEDIFIGVDNATNANHVCGRRYITEGRVTVGQVGGVDITGSSDLFDCVTGTVVDWKVVGKSTRLAAKAGPSPVYRSQVHLYGRGWANAGHHVEHVAICYLPRDAVTLSAGVWWTEPYDEQIALDALARANKLAAILATLASIGPDAVAGWITSLPRDPKCFDCARYGDTSGTPSPLADLVG